MVSRRTLARRLEAVLDFEDPTIELEQYLTPPELAAHIVHLASLQGDLSETDTVVDLGTGTGMLAIGATLAGPASAPARVIGLDVDAAALTRARENETRVASEETDAESDTRSSRIDWVRGDVRHRPLECSGVTVVSNPPFGTQRGNRHADRAFLETASEIASVSYTVHNEGSQAFVDSFASDAGGTVTHAFRGAFPVDHRFDFHTSVREELEVEVFRIEWERDERPNSGGD